MKQEDVTKYYAVRVGRKPGIYTNWFDAKVQIDNYFGAKYKSFPSREEAEEWMGDVVVEKTKYEVYCDGSSLGNGSKDARGGWGVLLKENGVKIRELNGSLEVGPNGEKATNQRAEIKAMIEALSLPEAQEKMTVYSDSMYTIQCLTTYSKNWKMTDVIWRKKDGKPVANQDLLEVLFSKYNPALHALVHVAGHSGDKDNDEVDVLAKSGALRETSAKFQEDVPDTDDFELPNDY
jgi:ribonuclease HI